MSSKNYKSLYLPALLIVVTVFVLLFVIASSTYRNINREGARMEERLLREARFLIFAIEAAAKENFSSGHHDQISINKILEDLSKNSEIADITLIDSKGRVVAYGSQNEKKHDIHAGTSLNLLLKEKRIISRYGHDSAGERTFEIIQPLMPLSLSGLPSRQEKINASGGENSFATWSQDKIVVVSFRLQVFDKAEREDFRHVILMGAILVILGTGTIYFIFIVQKYYRDLREMHELKERVLRSEHLASLGRLAAGIAHEIRNPLSSIRGFAQFFLNRFHGQTKEEEYAAVMVKEVDRLNRVISELLDFAHPRQPRLELCSIAVIMDYALKVLALELEKKKVVVEKRFADGLPLVPVDQEQLSQAFLNLLLNALEAVEEGGKIIINLKHDSYRNVININLKDNGHGIPPGDLDKIFEPFFSTKRKGTGLGLAVVKQIVENHGGEIRVENRPEGGTAFNVFLPIGCSSTKMN